MVIREPIVKMIARSTCRPMRPAANSIGTSTAVFIATRPSSISAMVSRSTARISPPKYIRSSRVLRDG